MFRYFTYLKLLKYQQLLATGGSKTLRPDLLKIKIRDYSVMYANFNFFYLEGFTSIPTALTANDRNRRIQVYQASDG